MIRIIIGNDSETHSCEINTMFRQRKRLFHDRLQWDVNLTDGKEIDAYDYANPIYLISLDDMSGVVTGSLRLLPTTGPNMLRDVFADMFNGEVLIESGSVWECTRFCVDPDVGDFEVAKNGLAIATCELLQGICEVGLLAGVTQIVGVFDWRMTRIYRRAEWSPDIIGSSDAPRRLEQTFVGLWDVSPQVLAEMRVSSGLPATVLEEPENTLEILHTAA